MTKAKSNSKKRYSTTTRPTADHLKRASSNRRTQKKVHTSVDGKVRRRVVAEYCFNGVDWIELSPEAFNGYILALAGGKYGVTVKVPFGMRLKGVLEDGR